MQQPSPRGGVLGLIFAGYVPLDNMQVILCLIRERDSITKVFNEWTFVRAINRTSPPVPFKYCFSFQTKLNQEPFMNGIQEEQVLILLIQMYT